MTSQRRRAGRRARNLVASAALAPPSQLLTQAVRRLARRRPDVFARLGVHQGKRYLIRPTDLPVGFLLSPSGATARVRIGGPERLDADVRIEGPLSDLLSLFDGSLDADAAFFSRRLRVEGDTAAMMALHNAIEAAELGLGDLFVAPPPLRALFGAGLHFAARRRASV